MSMVAPRGFARERWTRPFSAFGESSRKERCSELVEADPFAGCAFGESHVKGLGDALHELSAVGFRHRQAALVLRFGHRPRVERIASFRNRVVDGLAIGDASRQVGEGDQIASAFLCGEGAMLIA